MIAALLSKSGIYGILIFVIGSTWSACHQLNSSDLPYAYDQYRIKSTLTFADSLQVEDTTYYQLDYPKFEDPQVQDFITLVQLGTDTTDIYAAAQEFIAEYEAYQVNVPYPRVWTYETSTKVEHLNPVYLGLKSEHYSYTGGAHGLYAFWFSHYWLPTREVLNFGDLIDTSRMDALLPVAEKYFWTQERMNHPDMEPELYFFTDQKFQLPDNMQFDGDSVLFLYNIYEIKPYVYGHTEFRVPIGDMEPFLTDRAKHIVRELNN